MIGSKIFLSLVERIVKAQAMKYIFILLGFLNYYAEAQTNFIIAGKHDSTYYYHDFIPDTEVIIIPTASSFGYYSLDINNDGLLDFKIALLSPGTAMGGNSDYCFISPLDTNNEIALAYYDSCFLTSGTYLSRFGMINAFNYNDSINASAFWSNGDSYLEHWGYVLGNFSCQNSNYSDTTFIGIRLKLDSVYAYGWIQIGGITFNPWDTSSLTLRAFGFESKITGVNELINNDRVTIFPNPARNWITIQNTSNNIKVINVYNDLSERILSTNQKEIDVSDFNDGIYFVQVNTTQGSWMKKIIILR
jgi:hypothetical protein